MATFEEQVVLHILRCQQLALLHITSLASWKSCNASRRPSLPPSKIAGEATAPHLRMTRSRLRTMSRRDDSHQGAAECVLGSFPTPLCLDETTIGVVDADPDDRNPSTVSTQNFAPNSVTKSRTVHTANTSSDAAHIDGSRTEVFLDDATANIRNTISGTKIKKRRQHVLLSQSKSISQLDKEASAKGRIRRRKTKVTACESNDLLQSSSMNSDHVVIKASERQPKRQRREVDNQACVTADTTCCRVTRQMSKRAQGMLTSVNGSNFPSTERASNRDCAKGVAGIETCSPVIFKDNTASLHATGIQSPTGDGRRDLSVIDSQDFFHITLSMQSLEPKNPEADTGFRTPAIKDQDAGSKKYLSRPMSVKSQIPACGIPQRMTRSKAKMLRSDAVLFSDDLQVCELQKTRKKKKDHFCTGDSSAISSSDREQENSSFVGISIELNMSDHVAEGNAHIKTPISLVQGKVLVQATEANAAAQNTDFVFALPLSIIQTSAERFEDSLEKAMLGEGTTNALTSTILSINSKLKDKVDDNDTEKLSAGKQCIIPAVSSCLLVDVEAGIKGQVETLMPVRADKEPSDVVAGEKLDSSIELFMISGSRSKSDDRNVHQLQGSCESMPDVLHRKTSIGLEFVASGQQAKDKTQKAMPSSSSKGNDHGTGCHIRDTDEATCSSDLNHPDRMESISNIICALCPDSNEIIVTKRGNLSNLGSKDIGCLSHRKCGSHTPLDANTDQERGGSISAEGCDEGVDLPSRFDSQETLGASRLNYDNQYDSPNTTYPLQSDANELESLCMEQFNKSILQGRVNSSRRKRARLSSMGFDLAKFEFRDIEQSLDKLKWSNTFSSPIVYKENSSSQVELPASQWSTNASSSRLKGTEQLCTHASWTSIQKDSGTRVNEACYHGCNLNYDKGFMSQIGDGREMLTGNAGLDIEKQGHKRPSTPTLNSLYYRDIRVGDPKFYRDIINDLRIEEETYSEDKENKLSQCTKLGALSSMGCKRTKALRDSSRVNQLPPNIEKNCNISIGTCSSVVQQTSFSLPSPRGKRDIKGKSLGAASTPKQQERNRTLGKLELPNDILLGKKSYEGLDAMACKQGKPEKVAATYSCQPSFLMPRFSGCASKAQGLVKKSNTMLKVKRMVELKLKLDQQKVKEQQLQRRKEEKWKQKEVELATRKSKREEEEKKKREQRKRRFEDMQQSRKEQLRLDLEEKTQKKKALEEHDYERMRAKENKTPHWIKKEKEAERRTKNMETSNSFWGGKEAARKQAHISSKSEEMKVGKKSQICQVISSNKWAFSRSFLEEAELILLVSIKLLSSLVAGLLITLTCPFLLHPAQLPNMSKHFIQATPSYLNSGYTRVSQTVAGSATARDSICAYHLRLAPKNTSSLLVQSNLRAVENPNSDEGLKSYEISPYRGSSDDEDEEKADRLKKTIPLWARKENLMPQLQRQQYMDPDDIFQNSKTCSLEEIFQTRKSRRHLRRSGSGDWLQDVATWQEEFEYKRSMGYID